MAARIQQSPQPGGGKRKGTCAGQAGLALDGVARQLEPGIQGILITCNMNERKCVEEAYSLFNYHGDDMYGPGKGTSPREGGPLRRREGASQLHCRQSGGERRGLAQEYFPPAPAPILPGLVLEILAPPCFPPPSLITVASSICFLRFGRGF